MNSQSASDRTLPTYETTNKPWFGPRKRARQLLEAHRTSVLRPGPVALRRMKTVLGGAFAGIQRVRFIDFRLNAEYRFTIALCWTDSDPEVRDTIYELAPACVAATGWYPLPQGERLSSTASARRLGSGDELPEITTGELSSICAAADGSKAGTSVRVSFTDGATLLLDAGFGREKLRHDSDRIVLISHHHLDHIGGLELGRIDGMPVGLPMASALGLQAQGRLASIQGRHEVCLIEPGVRYRLGSSVAVSARVVPHMPGSVAYLLDDGQRALLYTGDIALASARHDVTQDLLSYIPEGRTATILLDATMAGRQEGASRAAPAQWVVEQSGSRDVAVVAHHDHLLYAYLDIFHTAKSGPARDSLSFIVTSRIRPLFGVLHDAFIRRRLELLDPFLAGQYGTSMSAWGESRWLYWLDRQPSVPPAPRVWFLTPDELEQTRLHPETEVLTIGRVELPPPYRAHAVDTTPWTGHSDQESLATGVRAFEGAGHDVVLFHNFRRRLTKFSRVNALQAQPLSSEPRPL